MLRLGGVGDDESPTRLVTTRSRFRLAAEQMSPQRCWHPGSFACFEPRSDQMVALRAAGCPFVRRWRQCRHPDHDGCRAVPLAPAHLRACKTRLRVIGREVRSA